MDPILIGITCVFVLAAVGLAMTLRSTTLSSLELGADERVLFELEGLTITSSGAESSSIYLNAIVRVTSRRLIVAQKPLFSKDPVLRYVLTLAEGPGTTVELGAVLKTGYTRCHVDPATFRLEGAKLVIPLHGDGLVGDQSLKIPARDLEPWRAAGLLGKVAAPGEP